MSSYFPLLTLYLTPLNLPTTKTILPKPRSSHCVTISLMLPLRNKCLTIVSSTSLLPLIPLITLSYFAVFLVCSAYFFFLSNGSHYIYRLAHPPMLFHLSRVVCRKFRFSDPFSPIFTPPLSVLSLVFPLYRIYFTP